MGRPCAHGYNLMSPQGEPGQRGADGASGLRVSLPSDHTEGTQGPGFFRSAHPPETPEEQQSSRKWESFFFFK